MAVYPAPGFGTRAGRGAVVSEESTDSRMQREKTERWDAFVLRKQELRQAGCTCEQALGPDGPCAVIYDLNLQDCPLHRDQP